nr:hypothetical protein QOL21_07520 [Acholeplasma laidlawii]
MRNELKINKYYNQNEMYIECKGNLQSGYRRYQNLPNYILFLFNHVRWINIDNNKFSPNEILNGITNRQNSKYVGLVPVMTQEIISTISVDTNISIENINEIFKLFDFCEYPTDLTSSSFYELMLSLPQIEFNKAAELTKMIYSKLERYEFNKTYNDSVNKTRFFKEGKILVSYMNNLRFVNAKEAYCPSINIIDKKGTNIVAKGLRTNNARFIDLLGCQVYKSEYEVHKYTMSQFHNDFSKKNLINLFIMQKHILSKMIESEKKLINWKYILCQKLK